MPRTACLDNSRYILVVSHLAAAVVFRDVATILQSLHLSPPAFDPTMAPGHKDRDIDCIDRLSCCWYKISSMHRLKKRVHWAQSFRGVFTKMETGHGPAWVEKCSLFMVSHKQGEGPGPERTPPFRWPLVTSGRVCYQPPGPLQRAQ